MDVDSYHVVMDMPGFSEEALIVAFSRLLDNKA
jgi:HSP20 family molecular chaperone IbpA